MDLIGKLKRARLAHLPTPLQPMPRLSAALGGPTLYIKRDDATGLATGGNKARKLEFLLGDAVTQGADTVLTVGATQSNHARQTAAAANVLGLRCILLLEDRIVHLGPEYSNSGNALLDDLLGAEVRRYPAGTNMARTLQDAVQEIRDRGGKPYAIPAGGSNPVGSAGYAECARELLEQAGALGIGLDHLVHATGSAGTQAGLLAGFEALERPVPVLGVSVRAERAAQEKLVHELACATARHLGTPPVPRERAVVDAGYVGEGYGLPTQGMLEAVQLVARTEGILLDPVYSGKAMAGLIERIRQGYFRPGASVVFLHTGGSAALFGYRQALARISA